MVMDTSATASAHPDAVGATHEGVNALDRQVFVFALFFIFGGITSLNDVIIPKLKVLIGVQKDPRSGVIGVEQGPLILMV